jgi:cytochrome c-type biogenesis protein CcmE
MIYLKIGNCGEFTMLRIKTLHKRVLSMILTVLMTFMVFPAGVFRVFADLPDDELVSQAEQFFSFESISFQSDGSDLSGYNEKIEAQLEWLLINQFPLYWEGTNFRIESDPAEWITEVVDGDEMNPNGTDGEITKTFTIYHNDLGSSPITKTITIYAQNYYGVFPTAFTYDKYAEGVNHGEKIVTLRTGVDPFIDHPTISDRPIIGGYELIDNFAGDLIFTFNTDFLNTLEDGTVIHFVTLSGADYTVTVTVEDTNPNPPPELPETPETPDYTLMVSGDSLTKGHITPYEGEGYSISGNTLTLNNFNFTTTSDTGLDLNGGITEIVLVGENSITVDNSNSLLPFSTGITSGYGLTISGQGSLTISVIGNGNDAYDASGITTASLTVSGATVDVSTTGAQRNIAISASPLIVGNYNWEADGDSGVYPGDVIPFETSTLTLTWAGPFSPREATFYTKTPNDIDITRSVLSAADVSSTQFSTDGETYRNLNYGNYSHSNGVYTIKRAFLSEYAQILDNDKLYVKFVTSDSSEYITTITYDTSDPVYDFTLYLDINGNLRKNNDFGELIASGSDELGGGTYSWDGDDTLTIEDISFTTTAAIAFDYTNGYPLEIVGNNSFTSTYNEGGSYGIYSSGHINFTGSGTIIAASSELSGYNSFAVYANNITVSGGTVTANALSTHGTGFCAISNINLIGGSLTATGGKYGVSTGGRVLVRDCTLEAEGGTYGIEDSLEIDENGVATATGGVSALSEAPALPAYYEWEVTSPIANADSGTNNYMWSDSHTSVSFEGLESPDYSLVLKSDGLHKGSAGALVADNDPVIGGAYDWDNTTNTLTLNGVNFITSADKALDLGSGTVIINLVGENFFNTTYSYGDSYGFYSTGQIRIDGTGSLSVTGGEAYMNENFGIYAAGNIYILGGSVTVVGNSGYTDVSYGLYTRDGIIYISGGSISANGEINALFSLAIFVSMPSYNWTADGGSGTYPTTSPAANWNTYSDVSITSVTAVSPITYTFNKAVSSEELFHISYSLAPGVTFNDVVKNGTTALDSATEWWLYDTNTIEITSSYLMGLDVGTYTIILDTTAEIDPTVTLTITNIYQYGLVLKSDGLYYNNAKLATNDSRLGGGTYSFEDNVLTLDDVVFTTSAATGLELEIHDDIIMIAESNNTITSTCTSSPSTGIKTWGSLIIQGNGSLTATAGNADESTGIETSNGHLTIAGANVSAIAGATGSMSYGVYTYSYNINITGGSLIASGNTRAISKMPVIYLPAYTWTKTGASGSYPGTAFTYNFEKSVSITTSSGVTPTAVDFYKDASDDLEIELTLAEGETFDGISYYDGELEEDEEYSVSGSTITISAEFLSGLVDDDSNLEFELTFNTSDDINPTTTITIYSDPPVHEHGLTIDSTGKLCYDGTQLEPNTKQFILGGGSYSFESVSSTLTLNNVDFTTSYRIALELTQIENVNLNITGINKIRSVYDGDEENTFGVHTLTDMDISGTGTLIATAGEVPLGYGSYGLSCWGNLSISGGTVTAIGESSAFFQDFELPDYYYWAVGDTELTASDDEPYEYDDEDLYLTIIFSEAFETYSVTVDNGTADREEYKPGRTVTITPDEPETGYMIADVTTDPECEVTENDGSYTFTMPDEDVEVTVTYEQIPPTTYAVTVTNGTADEEEYEEGDTVIITPSAPATGYRIESVTTDITTDISAVGDGTYSFTMPDEDVEVTVTYELIPPTTYAVTVTNGTADKTVYEANETVTITPTTPQTGYRIKNVTISPVIAMTTESNGTYTFTMPAESVTVTIIYEEIPEQGNTDNSGSSGNSGNPDIAPPRRDEYIEPTEPENDKDPNDNTNTERGISTEVNGVQSDVKVAMPTDADDKTADVTINGKTIETYSLTAAEAIADGEVSKVIVSESGAIAAVTKGGNVIAGANGTESLNSASTITALEAAAEILQVEITDNGETETPLITIIAGQEVIAVSDNTIEKLVNIQNDYGIESRIQKSQYSVDENEQIDELIYRITIPIEQTNIRDIRLGAEFDTAIVEASIIAFEKTFGNTDCAGFALTQKDTFGTEATIQVKMSAIGFEANPGDTVYVAIFNPKTGKFTQVTGKVGESGFITFKTDKSGVVVISATPFTK